MNKLKAMEIDTDVIGDDKRKREDADAKDIQSPKSKRICHEPKEKQLCKTMEIMKRCEYKTAPTSLHLYICSFCQYIKFNRDTVIKHLKDDHLCSEDYEKYLQCVALNNTLSLPPKEGPPTVLAPKSVIIISLPKDRLKNNANALLPFPNVEVISIIRNLSMLFH